MTWNLLIWVGSLDYILTVQKLMFSIKDLFSKSDQILSFLRFCAVSANVTLRMYTRLPTRVSTLAMVFFVLLCELRENVKI